MCALTINAYPPLNFKKPNYQTPPPGYPQLSQIGSILGVVILFCRNDCSDPGFWQATAAYSKALGTERSFTVGNVMYRSFEKKDLIT